MKKLTIKIQVFKNGKVAGTLIRDKGGVRMHGICGETVVDRRPLRTIVSALAAEGCVLKIIKAGGQTGRSASLQAKGAAA